MALLSADAQRRVRRRLQALAGREAPGGEVPAQCLVQTMWNPASEHVFTRAFGLEEHGSIRADGGAGVEDDGDFDGALPSCEQLREEQNLAWAQESVRYGVARAKVGAYADALTAYGKALDLCPQHADAFVARGAAFANQAKLREAVAEFDRAMLIEPDHCNARAYRDATLRKLNALPGGGADARARPAPAPNPPPSQLARREAPAPPESEPALPSDTARAADPSERAERASKAERRERREARHGKREKGSKGNGSKKSKKGKSGGSKKARKRRRHASDSDDSSSSSSAEGAEADGKPPPPPPPPPSELVFPSAAAGATSAAGPAVGQPPLSTRVVVSKRNLLRLAAGVDTAGYDYV